MHYAVKTHSHTISEHTTPTRAHRRAIEAAREYPGQPVTVWQIDAKTIARNGPTYRTRKSAA